MANINKKTCTCTECFLSLERDQSFRVLMVSIGLGFLLFLCGYYVGKRMAFESYIKTFEQESFSDRFQYAMLKFYGNKKNLICANNDGGESEEQAKVSPLAQESNIPKEPLSDSVQITEEKNTKSYKALLAGFATENAARIMIDRLRRHGIETSMVRRTSVNSSKQKKKKTVYWYQVVSNVFTDKNELERYIDIVKHLEHLRDVKVITLS